MLQGQFGLSEQNSLRTASEHSANSTSRASAPSFKGSGPNQIDCEYALNGARISAVASNTVAWSRSNAFFEIRSPTIRSATNCQSTTTISTRTSRNGANGIVGGPPVNAT